MTSCESIFWLREPKDFLRGLFDVLQEHGIAQTPGGRAIWKAVSVMANVISGSMHEPPAKALCLDAAEFVKIAKMQAASSLIQLDLAASKAKKLLDKRVSDGGLPRPVCIWPNAPSSAPPRGLNRPSDDARSP